MGALKLKLNDGNGIPQVGLGLWKVYLGVVARRAVRYALDAGYRHFDTAQIYLNEQHLGTALADSDIPRDQIFITTKIWNKNQSEDRMMPSFEKSLEKLQTDYVDLLLLHFPVTETRRDAWKRMEQIHKSGQAKSIGVSNYTIRHLKELLAECKVKPAVNQVEIHVFLQQPELIEFCRKNDIVVEAYSPLAHGVSRGMDSPVLLRIGEKHGKTAAQIMLRWCLQKGTVVLPKSTHKDRIKENIEIFDFSLDKVDMQEIANLNKDFRTAWDPTDVE